MTGLDLGYPDSARERYWAMLREREAIRLRRAAGAPREEWTANAILSEYRFCNVFREDDTVTQFIKREVRDPMANHPELLTAVSLARWINHPPTIRELKDRGAWWGANNWGGPWGSFADPRFRAHVCEVIRGRIDRGETAYTGAYMIRAESDPNRGWYNWPKEKYITDIVVAPTLDSVSFRQDSIEDATRALSELYGWGGFMAYEVATDLAFTPILSGATDLDTWANPGPGAKRGLNRIHGRDLNASLPVPKFVAEMRELFETRPAWTEKLHRRFRMREVEHGLCEFDKYERVRLGQGKPRSKYREATK